MWKATKDCTSEYSPLDLFAQSVAKCQCGLYGKIISGEVWPPSTPVCVDDQTYRSLSRGVKYGPDIGRQATGNPLKKCIQHKNHSDDRTMMGMISWYAKGKAIVWKHVKHWIHFTKMVHKCLPTLKYFALDASRVNEEIATTQLTP